MLQFVLCILLAVSYYAAAVATPDRHRWLLLSLGTVAFASAYGLSKLRPAIAQGLVLAVTLGTALLLAMPLSYRTPIGSPSWLAVILGVLTADAIWGASCLPVAHGAHVPFSKRLQAFARKGLIVALGLCVVASVVFMVAFATSTGPATHQIRFIALVYAGYLVGGVLVGSFIAAVLPLTNFPVVTMLLGAVGGALAYAAILPAVQVLSEPRWGPMWWGEQLGLAIACGTLIGPSVAVAWRYRYLDAKPAV